MERNNISFQYGIHRTPSAPNEGELAECVNLEAHNGELTPSVMPEVAFTLEDGEKLLFVHKTSNYKNYIVKNADKLVFFTDKNEERIDIMSLSDEYKALKFESLGNTLILSSEKGLEYILYKEEKYKHLGQKPPELDMSFKLELDRLDQAHAGIPIHMEGNTGVVTFDSTTQGYVTRLITSYLNPLLSKAESENWFTSTFFIRWAYRLYNGLYMVSPPVMMPLNLGLGPILGVTNYEGNLNDFTVSVYADKAKLQYEIPNFSAIKTKLEDWKDIITGVELYATKGVTRYNQSGTVKGIVKGDETRQCVSYGVFKTATADIYARRDVTYSENVYYIDGLHKDEKNYLSELLNLSLFYHLKSYRLDELNSGTNNVELAENAIANLTTSEALSKVTDEYLEHDKLYPEGMYIYNKRLNLYGVSSEKYNFPLYSLTAYTNGFEKDQSTYSLMPLADTGDSDDGTDEEEGSGGGAGTAIGYERKGYSYNVRFVISDDGQTINVTNINNDFLINEPPLFLFYPDNNARKAIIERYDLDADVKEQSEVTLISHPILQGCYWYGGLEPLSFSAVDESNFLKEELPEARRIYNGGKIFTSNVNNPFVYPIGGINQIGTGNVIAVATNSKAISPGQFGQYPMIVFSSDGVWAMQTGNDGLYESIHPISRDVCTNPNILQTDGPVLFATENGLHSIVGSEVENISKHIKGKPESIAIPSWDASFDLLATTATDDETFNNFIQEASFAYDYANSRVLIFKDGTSFAYVLSTESGTISKLVLLNNGNAVNLASAINAYPEVYMQSGKDVYTFVPDKDITEATLSKGYIITRPLSFSDPLAMKVINDVRLIYHRSTPESKCRYAMFVSNDGHHWAVRNSLRGHSFKFFRFAIFTELADTDALQGMSVMFDFRRTNKLR